MLAGRTGNLRGPSMAVIDDFIVPLGLFAATESDRSVHDKSATAEPFRHGRASLSGLSAICRRPSVRRQLSEEQCPKEESAVVVSRMKSTYPAALIGIAVMALGSCGGSHQPSAASVVVKATNLSVPAPEGISVKVTGTTAVVNWSAPKGLSVPLKSYEFYLDQTPAVSVGPQVTSRKLTGLASESHYVQVVALTATGQSEPIAASFAIAYADAQPSPAASPTPEAANTTPSQPSVAAPTSDATQPPSQTRALSVADACDTVMPDLSTVDSDAAAVIRGDNNEVATGHGFGALIIELQGVSQNVSDAHLAGLVNTVTGVVVSIRNLFVAGGDPMNIDQNLDPDIAAVQEYCSTQTDPLGSTA